MSVDSKAKYTISQLTGDVDYTKFQYITRPKNSTIRSENQLMGFTFGNDKVMKLNKPIYFDPDVPLFNLLTDEDHPLLVLLPFLNENTNRLISANSGLIIPKIRDDISTTSDNIDCYWNNNNNDWISYGNYKRVDQSNFALDGKMTTIQPSILNVVIISNYKMGFIDNVIYYNLDKNYSFKMTFNEIGIAKSFSSNGTLQIEDGDNVTIIDVDEPEDKKLYQQYKRRQFPHEILNIRAHSEIVKRKKGTVVYIDPNTYHERKLTKSEYKEFMKKPVIADGIFIEVSNDTGEITEKYYSNDKEINAYDYYNKIGFLAHHIDDLLAFMPKEITDIIFDYAASAESKRHYEAIDFLMTIESNELDKYMDKMGIIL